jgi:hypothetical protein
VERVIECREEEAVPMGQTEARLPGGVRRMGRTARRADPANSRGAQSDFGVKAPEQWLEGKRRQNESDGEHEVRYFWGVGRRYATSRWSGENILRNGASFLLSFRIPLDHQKVPIGATMQRLILPLLLPPGSASSACLRPNDWSYFQCKMLSGHSLSWRVLT